MFWSQHSLDLYTPLPCSHIFCLILVFFYFSFIFTFLFLFYFILFISFYFISSCFHLPSADIIVCSMMLGYCLPLFSLVSTLGAVLRQDFVPWQQNTSLAYSRLQPDPLVSVFLITFWKRWTFFFLPFWIHIRIRGNIKTFLTHRFLVINSHNNCGRQKRRHSLC